MKEVEFYRDQNKVTFSHYRKNHLFYHVQNTETKEVYQFYVPIEDCGDATFKGEDKALLFKRYIRKALENGELNRVG